MDALRSWVRGRTGPARYALACGLGLLFALAQAPYSLWPLLAIAFPGLFWLLEGCASAPRPHRAGFATASAFGFGACALGLYWVAFAFLVQAEDFAWMIPVLVPGLWAYLSIYSGLAGLVVVALLVAEPAMGPVRRVALFAGAWTLAELLRGEVFGGFPWNLTAQASLGWLPLAQGLGVLGPYGLGLVLTFLFTLPAVAGPRRWPLAVGPGGLALLAALGALALVPTDAPDPAARLVVAQPSIPQRDKLDPGKREANLLRTLQMTAEAAGRSSGPTYALWPENAYPYLAEQPGVGAGLADLLPDHVTLVTGSVRAWEDGRHYRFANAVEVFGPTRDGEKPHLATYDKHHLVPFGEFLPLSGLMQRLGLASLSPVGAGGFEPGPGPRTLAVGPSPFAPLVCYESVFPGEMYPASSRPDWLALVTNDAWFGDGAGPKQHLAIGRMRAIETGLPMARAANTGISAVIDARGRVLEALPLYEPGVIAASLPAPLPPTLYASLRELPFAALLLVCTLGASGLGLATRRSSGHA